MDRRPDSIDVLVGRRLSELRSQRRATRLQLADAMGISPHQLYKYEMGKNRIAASRLSAAAKWLDVPVVTFFSGVDERAAVSPYGHAILHLMELMRELTPEHQERVVAFAQDLEKMQKSDIRALTPANT